MLVPVGAAEMDCWYSHKMGERWRMVEMEDSREEVGVSKESKK